MKDLKNELAQSLSPYLLQHASQPVAWQMWRKRRLEEAAAANQLLLISIGYSACHWCHVMAHESFDNSEVASYMNRHFVNFKIDREERPDVDHIYMSALQILTGQGGWPLNIIALPNGQPIWGATYLPKENWLSVLQQIQKIYQNQPEKLREQAQLIQEGMQQMLPVQSLVSPPKNEAQQYVQVLDKLYANVDLEYGGFLGAPKFMMPVQLNLWQAAGQLFKKENYLKHYHNTLTKMAMGGLFDAVEGGFSRYSVDERWHVPHFEKMAYDNGQLLTTYSQAYLLQPEAIYKEVVAKTIDFIETCLSSAEGGIFSALDADSLNAQNKMEEGAYYVWTPQELKTLLKEDFERFAAYYQVNENGYWEKGQYVFIRAHSLSEFCDQNGLDPLLFQDQLAQWHSTLKQAKKNRAMPALDDKQICAWNAMVCEGLLMASRIFKEPNFAQIAAKTLAFIQHKFVGPDQQLMRIYKNKTLRIKGLLEDYAHLIKLYLTAYETYFDEVYLHEAVVQTEQAIKRFWDEKVGLFNSNSKVERWAWSHSYEIEDNVIISHNALMAENLWRLALHADRPKWQKQAEAMCALMQESVRQYPRSHSGWLTLFLRMSKISVELAVVGPNYKEILAQLQQHPYPFISWAGAEQATTHPLLQQRGMKGKTLIYLCQNRQCDLPKENWEIVWEQLNQLTS